MGSKLAIVHKSESKRSLNSCKRTLVISGGRELKRGDTLSYLFKSELEYTVVKPSEILLIIDEVNRLLTQM